MLRKPQWLPIYLSHKLNLAYFSEPPAPSLPDLVFQVHPDVSVQMGPSQTQIGGPSLLPEAFPDYPDKLDFSFLELSPSLRVILEQVFLEAGRSGFRSSSEILGKYFPLDL